MLSTREWALDLFALLGDIILRLISDCCPSLAAAAPLETLSIKNKIKVRLMRLWMILSSILTLGAQSIEAWPFTYFVLVRLGVESPRMAALHIVTTHLR